MYRGGIWPILGVVKPRPVLDLASRHGRALRLSIAALGAACAAWRIVGGRWSDIEYLPILALAALGAWHGGAARTGRAALGWRLVSLAWSSSAVAVVLWWVTRIGPAPWLDVPAAVLWNAYYALMVGGLVLMTARLTRRAERARAVLEAITVALACGLLIHFFVIRHAPDLVTVILNGVGEPCVLVAAAVLLARDHSEPAQRQLGAGALFASMADLTQASTRGGLDLAVVADVVLCASAVLVAIAGLQRPGWRRPLRRPLEIALRGMGHLPSLSVLGVLIVLAGAAHGGEVGALPVLTIGAVVLAVFLLASLAVARYDAEVEEDARAAQTERLAATQRYVALGQIAGAAVHDLNNMITVVDGVAEELRALDPPPVGVGDLEAASRRAAAVCRQLLTFGARRPETTADVTAVIHELETLLRRLVPRKLGFEVDAAGALAAVVDRAQLEMALVNLVTNARDATSAGTIVVRADPVDVVAGDPSARRGVGPGRWIRLAVRDPGVGMDAAVAAQVFEPFVTSKGERGTGLGLAQVADLARQAGGHALIDSAPGAGTEVSIWLRPA